VTRRLHLTLVLSVIALAGGPDGLSWRRIAVSCGILGEQATKAGLLPGGVLLSDGTTTWFGEAVTK
jgi:hypothetical protein